MVLGEGRDCPNLVRHQRRRHSPETTTTAVNDDGDGSDPTTTSPIPSVQRPRSVAQFQEQQRRQADYQQPKRHSRNFSATLTPFLSHVHSHYSHRHIHLVSSPCFRVFPLRDLPHGGRRHPNPPNIHRPRQPQAAPRSRQVRQRGCCCV